MDPLVEQRTESQICSPLHNEGQGPDFTGVRIGKQGYHIPNWFHRQAISTPQDADAKRCNLRIIDTVRRDPDDDSEDSTAYKKEMNDEPGGQGDPFEIHRDLYSELQDTIAAACVVDNQEQLLQSDTSVLLRYNSNSGRAFCDEVLSNIAKDMRASLITLGLEDMADLAAEFDNEEKIKRKFDNKEVSEKQEPDRNDEFGLFKHYFAVRCKRHETEEARERNRRAITSLLESLDAEMPRRAAEAGESSASRQGVLLLYVRDTKEILNLVRGLRFFSRFWEVIAEKRKEGNPIVLICNVAADEDKTTWCCQDCDRKSRYRLRTKIRTATASVVNLISCGNNTKRNTDLDYPTGTRNMRRIKRALRTRMAYAFNGEDLEPNGDWSQKGLAPQSMDKAFWSQKDLQSAVTRIAGRYWRRSKVDLDDVRDVLTSMDLLHAPAGETPTISEDNDKSNDPFEDDDGSNDPFEDNGKENQDSTTIPGDVNEMDSGKDSENGSPDNVNSETENVSINENESEDTDKEVQSDKDEEEDIGPPAWPTVVSRAGQAWQEQKTTRNESNTALDQLMNMIGLESVKRKLMEVKDLVDTSSRQGVDLKSEYFGCLFVGKPGSGKTVVATIYAKLLSLLKIVSGSQLRTTTGIRLCNGGISECENLIRQLERSSSSFSTLSNSDDSFDRNGGVLLVEEAHELLTRQNGVLEFLVSEIDRLRGKVVFIFAGYPKPMETFLSFTPGLQSRIPFKIKFEDYEDGELHKILIKLLKKKFKGKMRVEDGINGLYMRIVVRRIGRARSRTNFANAREVQNALLSILFRQASRLAASRRRNEEAEDFFLTKADLIGPPPSTALETSAAWRSLRNMIGLNSVKESVQALIDQLQVNYERELAELPLVACSLNKVFLGNPGTGKTTVAKYYGQILVEIGLLSNGEVMTKTPTDFIGVALGESENNTKAILTSAQGKVLIIDEAYGLSGSLEESSTTTSQNIYKSVVVDTIVAEVQGTINEDRCVLMLGYKDKMEAMFQSVNPALGRRFPLSSAFDFQDYSSEEMRQILNLRLAESGFTASDRAKEIAMMVLNQTRNHRNYGNAGEVDILLDRAKIQQRKRLSTLAKNGDANLRFEPQDFDPDFDRADHAENSIHQLFADFVGAEALIDRMEGYTRIARNAEDLEIDPRSQIPFTFLFRGPPGTGKTTTARRMGEFFYSMGFLATKDVINCSGTDLIGEFVGHTGPKTRRVFQKALGKVLFIDEAYQLSDHRFGHEAVTEMMNLLTQDRYRNKMIVILAGYEQDMNRLLSINPGFSSRFSEVLQFDHLAPKQCFKLLVRCLQEQKLDTSTIEAPTENEFLGRFKDLSTLPGWSNARDVQVLARSVFCSIMKSKTQPPSLVVTDEIIQNEMDQMLSERRGRTKNAKNRAQTHNSKPRPSSSYPSETERQKETSVDSLVEAISRKENTPVALSNRIDAQRNSYRASVDKLQPEMNTASVQALTTPTNAADTTPRDDGVSDATWTQLQKDKAQKKRKRQEINDFPAKFARLKSDIGRIEAAGGDSSQVRQQLTDQRKSFKQMKTAADTDSKIVSRLMQSGLCPFGYEWIKESDGYRCAGGMHFMSNEDIRSEYNL